MQLRLPSLLCYDSTAAADVAFGEATEAAPSTLGNACIAQLHLLRLHGCLPARLHIPSHTGHPFNDLVDVLAKAAARRAPEQGLPPQLHEACQDGVLDSLWIACNVHRALPHVAEDGILYDEPHTAPGSSLAYCLDLQATQEPETAQIDVEFSTYNCLTRLHIEQKEALDRQFASLHMAAVGLQETRVSEGPRSASTNFHILGSNAIEGQL